MPGKPLYSITSYAFNGLDNTGDPIGVIANKPSKDYAAIIGTKSLSSDLIYSGSAIPEWFGSLINSFNWHHWYLDISMIYKGAYYFRRTSINYNSLFTSGVGHKDFSHRWLQPGDETVTDIPAMKYPLNTSRETFYANSNALVTPGDHIRLQYIRLSYRTTIHHLHLQQLEAFLNCSNITILWKKNHYGIDPENKDIPAPMMTTIGCRFIF